jgi:hypothetical protein
MNARDFTVCYGITNALKFTGRDAQFVGDVPRFAYFGDFDEPKGGLRALKTRVRAEAERVFAGYACILESSPRHYHVVIPGVFEADEIARLHQHFKPDAWFVYKWAACGYNALRFTPKHKGEASMRIVFECTPRYWSTLAANLADFLKKAYGANIPQTPDCLRLKHRLAFVRYQVDAQGHGYRNQVLDGLLALKRSVKKLEKSKQVVVEDV